MGKHVEARYEGLEKVMDTEEVNVGDILVRHEGSGEGRVVKVVEYEEGSARSFKRGWLLEDGTFEEERNYGGNRFSNLYFWYKKNELIGAEDL